MTTWARGVEVSSDQSINNCYPRGNNYDLFPGITRVKTDYIEEAGTIIISWGGAERGHDCVTHYDVKVRFIERNVPPINMMTPGVWPRARGGGGRVPTDSGPAALCGGGGGAWRRLHLHPHARVHRLPGGHHRTRRASHGAHLDKPVFRWLIQNKFNILFFPGGCNFLERF